MKKKTILCLHFLVILFLMQVDLVICSKSELFVFDLKFLEGSELNSVRKDIPKQ